MVEEKTIIPAQSYMNAPFNIDLFLQNALAEDIGDGDHTSLSTIKADALGKAKLLVKDTGILAGVDIAQRVFRLVDARLQFEKKMNDGDPVTMGDIAFYVSGSARSITTAERLALNIMQRMSAIATKTHRIQQMIADTGCQLLDTRKTTPGFRYFEKLAVKIGGGENHRTGLYDMILVKDNHSDYSGGLDKALQNVKHYLQEKKLDLKVEAEARNMDEVEAIIQSGIVFRVLLDNFLPPSLKEAVEYIAGRIQTEASGGINETNVREYALTGVNYISMGALTHQISSLDMSLKAV